MNQIDYTDKEIIKILLQNAKTPYLQIAKKLKISNSMVHQRVKKLREAGILKEPGFAIDPAALGYNSCASMGIMLKESKFVDRAVEELAKIPEIVECLNVTGKYALMVKVYARDNDHLRKILYEKVHMIKGIEGTNTAIIFNAGFSRNIPID